MSLRRFFLNSGRAPAVRLRLARCTAWVKRWSEALDFLQTIFKTNIFLWHIFKNYITMNRNNVPMIMSKSKVRQKFTDIHTT